MAENKMEQVDFWIRYFKEHINTIGCVELDGLDCREVLALLQELADKKADKPNKMEAVAQLFGKQLDEHFCVSCCNTRFLLKFTSDGLWVFDDSWGHWNGEDGMIEALLRGEAVIIDD